MDDHQRNFDFIVVKFDKYNSVISIPLCELIDGDFCGLSNDEYVIKTSSKLERYSKDALKDIITAGFSQLGKAEEFVLIPAGSYIEEKNYTNFKSKYECT